MKHQCREVTHLVLQSQDQALNWRERLRVRVHLLMCTGCRRFSAHTRFMTQAMRAWRKQDEGRSDPEPPKTH